MIALVGAMFVAMGSASAAPAAPSGLKAMVNEAEDTLTLSWGIVEDATDFDVRYREDGTDDWTDPDADDEDDTTLDLNDQVTSDADRSNWVSPMTTFAIDGTVLTIGKTYQFQVRAGDGSTEADHSSWSETLYADAGQKEALGACKPTQTLVLDDAGLSETGDGTVDTPTPTHQFCTITIAGGAPTAQPAPDFEATPSTSSVVGISGAVDSSNWVYTITAAMVGSETFTVSGKANNLNVGGTYTFTVVEYMAPVSPAEQQQAEDKAAEDAKTPAIKISFDDSDGVVSAGTDVAVTITTDGMAMLERVTVSGGLDLYNDDVAFGTGSSAVAANAFIGPRSNSSDESLVVVIPKGTAAGTYTVAASGNNGEDKDDNDFRSLSASKVITVGEPGNAVANATLTLGLKDDPKGEGGYNSPTDATDDKPENGFAGQSGSINLELTVTNGLGNPVNPSDVQDIRIVAPFGVVTHSTSGTDFPNADSNTIDGDALSKTSGRVILQISSEEEAARTIEVHAIVIGETSGIARTEPVMLTFTGAAASAMVEDGTTTLRNVNVDGDHSITLMVSAEDKSGNTAQPPIVVPSIANPDGVAVASTTISASAPTQGADGLWRITVANVSGDSAATALKTGEYTLKLKSGSVEDTAAFTVVGKADSVELMADDNAPSSVGQAITVTATVTDADGNPVADGTVVTFTSRDTTADDDSVLVFTSSSGTTKGGEAQAMLVAVGPGSSVVTATADGKVAVAVITSSAGAADPVAEEASVSCLSNLSGFSTWSCGAESSASEIFGLVSDRDATALHLWNGSAWVRYSVVEGTVVPGSSDFMVTQYDTLYISN